VAQSILVAEDERNLVEALSFLMERAGYDVSVARDGPATVEMARRLKPDLVLLDIMLPGYDGFEVIAALKICLGRWRPLHEGHGSVSPGRLSGRCQHQVHRTPVASGREVAGSEPPRL
jgi:FixJ family two-component response regulator